MAKSSKSPKLRKSGEQKSAAKKAGPSKAAAKGRVTAPAAKKSSKPVKAVKKVVKVVKKAVTAVKSKPKTQGPKKTVEVKKTASTKPLAGVQKAGNRMKPAGGKGHKPAPKPVAKALPKAEVKPKAKSEKKAAKTSQGSAQNPKDAAPVEDAVVTAAPPPAPAGPVVPPPVHSCNVAGVNQMKVENRAPGMQGQWVVTMAHVVARVRLLIWCITGQRLDIAATAPNALFPPEFGPDLRSGCATLLNKGFFDDVRSGVQAQDLAEASTPTAFLNAVWTAIPSSCRRGVTS